MAQALGETIRNAVTAGKGAKAVIDDVRLVFGTAIEVTFKFGLKCLGQADSATKQIADRTGGAASDAFKKLDGGLDDAARADVPAQCYLSVAETALSGFNVAQLGTIFFTIEPSTALISPQTATSRAKCPIAQLRLNLKNDPRFNTLYGNAVKTKAGFPRGTDAHHIVPKNDSIRAANRCAFQGGDICDDTRQILVKYNINLNDGDNGVFLPRLRNSPIYQKYQNATFHDRKTFHTLRYYEQVADDLALVEEELLAAGQSAAKINSALRGKLQEVADKLLAGSYPK